MKQQPLITSAEKTRAAKGLKADKGIETWPLTFPLS
jgi:hypothetical protein